MKRRLGTSRTSKYVLSDSVTRQRLQPSSAETAAAARLERLRYSSSSPLHKHRHRTFYCCRKQFGAHSSTTEVWPTASAAVYTSYNDALTRRKGVLYCCPWRQQDNVRLGFRRKMKDEEKWRGSAAASTAQSTFYGKCSKKNEKLRKVARLCCGEHRTE